MIVTRDFRILARSSKDGQESAGNNAAETLVLAMQRPTRE
jgi:hypothetical protein